MNKQIAKTSILVAGLITALVLPGMASAGERSKYSLKEQSRERYDSRHYQREGRHHERDRFRRDDRHSGHRRDYARGHRHGHHDRHAHRHNHGHYRDHRYCSRHGANYYRHHSGLHVSGLYVTPHVGLSLHLGH